jgi:hypothetical protein
MIIKVLSTEKTRTQTNKYKRNYMIVNKIHVNKTNIKCSLG